MPPVSKKQSSPDKHTKILVVEDDRAYAHVFERKLAMENFEVKVSNGADNISDLVASFKPDLMILDLVLPGKSGFDIIEEVRSGPQGKMIIIIIASNLSQDSDRDKAMAAGANDYFIKSNISVNEMVDRVKKAVHN